ncbi:hypothetical protein [uncultured Eubacterium sp.]|uniref:hypothetical protein n=1 Tax=uncultured Eubacterium sp. TaxID=165185 RepID=UPI00260222A7|nr:hypothetical protein [uncultured Eubacterium sp.]
MRKIVKKAIIYITAASMLVGVSTVAFAESKNNYDFDGDVVKNPWEEEIREDATTKDEETTTISDLEIITNQVTSPATTDETTNSETVETTKTGTDETTKSGMVETTKAGTDETTKSGTVETTKAGIVETTRNEAVETSTAKNLQTTKVPQTTKVQPITKNQQATTAPIGNVLGATKVKKATKKNIKFNKIKITFKKVKGAQKYIVEISQTKKFKKVIVRKKVKKVSVTIKRKILRNKKKLYVRIKAVGAQKWSAPKKVKIKK